MTATSGVGFTTKLLDGDVTIDLAGPGFALTNGSGPGGAFRIGLFGPYDFFVVPGTPTDFTLNVGFGLQNTTVLTLDDGSSSLVAGTLTLSVPITPAALSNLGPSTATTFAPFTLSGAFSEPAVDYTISGSGLMTFDFDRFFLQNGSVAFNSAFFNVVPEPACFLSSR